MKRLRNMLDKIIVKDEDYKYVMDEICENNRKIILILCPICIAIFSILITLGFLGLGVDMIDVPVFAAALLVAVCLMLLLSIKRLRGYTATMIATYLTMGAVMFYGLLISYRTPDQYTVSFIAMMGIMSMTFVDKPWRIGIAHVLVTAACVCMICIHKSEEVRVPDLINVISFSLLSFIGGLFTVSMRVHGYVMDKLHQENIEIGRKQLDAKKKEALHLLTAVQSAYDMVVSVNLTQNTYKLLGYESFVTQGDDAEGCFDDVINTHAAKVIPEHRQRYLDTFSRNGLLRAYNEGKKEVYLEYMQCDEDGIPHWLGTHTMFIDDPKSSDVTEITISQNVDERVRREEETKAILEEERDKAQKAQKAKTDFLFQMSHDIRTPMNAILGFTNFIKSSDDLFAIHNDYIPKLETAGGQLLMLINDALEMSRIESGKLVFRREIQDIRTIISNVLAVMQIHADEKGVELISDIEVEHPIVNCDQNHLNRVIMNLLSNAVKFTPTGGRVKVSLHEKPNSPNGYTSFKLKVADNGIGMSKEFLKKVFEPFEREQTSTVSGMQGTGLGLAIVSRIINAAGDTISVESEQGKGTVFTIDITLIRGEAEECKKCPRSDPDLPPFDKMVACFKGKRILLAEDNEFNLTIACTLLENAGFSVETASDGKVAVNKVVGAPTEAYYDAILMDIQMPIMNGYEATEEIRKLPDGRSKTVIIALTANAFDTDKENSIRAGMNGHIAKPIDITELYKTLWELL